MLHGLGHGLIWGNKNIGLTPVFNLPFQSSVIPFKGDFDSFNRTSVTTVVDFERLTKYCLAKETPFPGARREFNLIAGPSNIPITQDITVISGNQYQMRIGATSASGATAECSDAFIETLTGDAVDPQGFDVAKTASTTTLTVTIIGTVTDLMVVDVTGRANQNPPEYVPVGVGTEAEIQLNGDMEIGDLTATGTNNPGWSWSSSQWEISSGGLVADASVPAAASKQNAVVGRLYAVIYTIANVNAFAIPTFGGVALISNLIGTHISVIRALTTFGFIPTSGIGAGTTYDNISIKEIQHGTNVDGVQCFPTLNYNKVTSNVIGTLAAPVGAEIQQLADPNFLIDNTTSDGTGSDWLWSSSEWSITSNALRTAGFAKVVKTRLTYEVGTYIRVKWTVNNPLGNMFLGSHIFPLIAGSHDVIVRVPSTPGDLTIQSGAAAPNISNFEITPITQIPEDFLLGHLPEEAATNDAEYSHDFSTARDAIWSPIVNITKGTTPIVCPDGITRTTNEFIASGVNGIMRQTVTAGINSRNFSCQLQRKTGDGTGTIEITVDGTTWVDITSQLIADVWVSVDTGLAAVTNPSFGIRIGTSGNTIYIDEGQCEATFYATSFIENLTTGSTTRTDEVSIYELPILLQGDSVNNFCVVYTVEFKQNQVDKTTNSVIFDYTADGTNEVMGAKGGLAGDGLRLIKVVGGVDQSVEAPTNILKGVIHKVVNRYSAVDGIDQYIGRDGGVGAIDGAGSNTADLDFSISPTKLFIGSTVAGTFQPNAYIKKFEIYRLLTPTQCVVKSS